MMVLPNGATINVRYPEPRRLIKLPFDITSLSDAEQKLRMAKRQPKTEIRLEEELDVDFDASKYLSVTKKKK